MGDEELSSGGSADGFLLPPSVDEWLPQRHLARFVVEVIEGLDLRAMIGSYRGSGSASYHPALLLGLLVYGYATGVFSSRKLERATYDSVAFRFIAANDHPDHDTIATFRQRFLPEIEELFVKVLVLAREMGVLKLGTVALDGTKIHANASRYSALSYEYAGKLEAQLQAEVAELLAKAEAADKADVPDGTSTGVCPQVATCRGPRTDPAGLMGTTWPVTSQSNKWRIAASRCVRLGAASSRAPASIHATCTGCTAAIDGTPASAHQAKNSSAARAYARRVCGLRMLAAKNSRKRMPARSPATATIAGTTGAGERMTRWFTDTSSPKPSFR